MEPAPTPPFEVVDTAAGRLYRLPQRQLGPMRLFAGFPLVFAITVAVLLMQFYLRRAAKGPLDEWAWATFVLTGVGWTRAAYSLVSLAAVIWSGRTEIEIADSGAAWATDRVGWFRVRWGKLRPATARKLVLAAFAPVPDAKNKAAPQGGTLWTLTAETDRGRKVWLAPAHPREVLAALADELANRLALAAPPPADDPNTGEPLPAAQMSHVSVVVEEPEIPSRDVLAQPAGSRIVLERHPDGVTATVPPLGFGGSNCALLFGGMIFGTVGGVLTATLIARLFRPNPRMGGEFVGVVFLFVGIGLILAAVQAARKRAVLAVVGERLLTFESGPLGSRRREFVRGELLDIDVGPSNVKVNNKPLPQLQIVPSGDTAHVGMLTGRDHIELLWLATVLRQALGVPSEAPEHREPGAPFPPWRRE